MYSSLACVVVSSNRVIYTVDDGVHFRMAKGKRGSLSKLALGTQEFSLLSLAQVCSVVGCGIVLVVLQSGRKSAISFRLSVSVPRTSRFSIALCVAWEGVRRCAYDTIIASEKQRKVCRLGTHAVANDFLTEICSCSCVRVCRSARAFWCCYCWDCPHRSRLQVFEDK